MTIKHVVSRSCRVVDGDTVGSCSTCVVNGQQTSIRGCNVDDTGAGVEGDGAGVCTSRKVDGWPPDCTLAVVIVTFET